MIKYASHQIRAPMQQPLHQVVRNQVYQQVKSLKQAVVLIRVKTSMTNDAAANATGAEVVLKTTAIDISKKEKKKKT